MVKQNGQTETILNTIFLTGPFLENKLHKRTLFSASYSGLQDAMIELSMVTYKI